MTLWDSLAPVARDSGALSGLESLLRDVGVTTSSTDEPGAPPRRHITASWSPSGGRPLSFDPSGGGFALSSAGSSGTPLEFPDPRVSLDLLLELDGPGGDPTGPFTAKLTVPSAVLRLPFLRGARLDATGMLEPDPAHPQVAFTLPRLVIQADYTDAAGGLQTKLASASTSPPAGADPADLYDFVRMDPPYALVGPGAVIGFGFRVAALDLSATSNPPGGAHAMPVDWQGLWLPEARLFVQPSGMEGLAVSAGVEDLWIGIGVHAGVTGTFGVDVVNRASSPTLRIRFQDAQGRWYSTPGAATTATLPEQTTVYLDAGSGLAPLTYSVRVAGVTTASDRASVTTPAAGTVEVIGNVTDGLGRTVSRTVTCSRRTTPASGPSGGQPATVTTTSSTGSQVVVVSQTATEVTLRLDPAGGTVAWSWAGGSATAAQATVPLAAGATLDVTATRTQAAAAPVTFDCYWLVDHPRAAEDGLPPDLTFAYSLNPANTNTSPALPDGSDFSPGGQQFQSPDVRARLAALPAGTPIVVDGFASNDGPSGPTPAYNQALSERRMRGLMRIVQALRGSADGITAGTAHGQVGSAAQRNVNWHATATATPAAASNETVTAHLERLADPPPERADLDRPPERPPVPACFHRIGARVELVRSTFVRAELFGEFDVQTAAEQRLAANALGALPPRDNPQDGVCSFLVRLRVDESRSRWDVLAEFRALDADKDGLAQVKRPTAGGTSGIDALGAVAALAPVLSAATPPSPTAGELVGLGVATAAVAAVGATGVVSVQSVTLHGGELRVSDGPEGTMVALLLDVETTLSFDLVIIRVLPDKPITTRYKAVGLKSTWDTPPAAGGGVDFVPVWMFDPSAGYSLDVPTGSLVARDPFGDLLRVLGFKVSRDNPTYLEAEVGIGADLGIVQIDAVRVRVRIDAAEAPQITAFGASVDVPGVLHGSGYLSLPPEGGVTGFVDLTITALSIRVAAAVKIESKDGVTGVFVGIEVDFPVPIVLGSSGLGIFGFLGGVGVNFERIEPTGVPAPALRWLEQQIPLPLGVLNPAGWRAAPGKYAFAAGILLGTLEGGYVVHLKGIVIFELPGPRLLFVMKADVLKAPPALRGSESATFLAVLDLDFGRGTITIGLVAEYEIPVLLHVRIPVTAFFSTTDVPAWFVDLGTWQDPVTVKVFTTFEGVGYLMIHGRSITPAPPALASVVTSGLTVAAGLHVQFVWGSTDIGLYLKIAGGFDAIISFQPFAFGGVITISGELRLFIVSVGASATLTVLAGHGKDSGGNVVDRTFIHGEVCGHVDFFFFSVEGCVGFSLGNDDVPDPDPDPLVKGVVLISRSPALIEGTATDRAVDGKLADARDTSSGAPAPDPVPLDAIPVVLFDVAPDATGLSVFGSAPVGGTGLDATHWTRRGRRWWAYRVDAVELVGALGAGGSRPSVWWSRGLDHDPKHGPALALLSWLPTATPKAVVYGETLTTTVTEEWGTVCEPAAPPATVLWTFDDEASGPSASGWTLRATAWPDPPGTFRSTPVRADLRVTERWRCGDLLADLLRGIDPARVLRDAVACPSAGHGPADPADPFTTWSSGQPTTPSRSAVLDGQGGLRSLVDAVAAGTSLADARAFASAAAWDPALEAGRSRLCAGAVLQSPVDDGPEPIRRGSQDDEKLVLTAWDAAGFTPGELVDAVRLGSETGLRSMRVLLLLSERAANGGLLVRCLDAAGGVLGEQPVDSGSIVQGGHPLPSTWVDPGGPFADPVERAGRVAAVLRLRGLGQLLSLVEVKIVEGTVTVEIGYARDVAGDKRSLEPFFVVAAEGLTEAEVLRADWDTTTVSTARDALTTSLTEDPDNHALLVPGGDYTVRVTWRAAHSGETDNAPSAPPAEADYGPPQVQEYAFSAEGQDRVPDRLEPWLLATSPGPKEVGTFCNEPVRIAFSSQAVSTLFAAYGTELRAFVHSASGRHPTAPGQDAAGPFALASAEIAPVLVPVYGPWETAARELVADLPCIPAVGERVDGVTLTIPYAFDPCTDYLLDVERVPLGAPAAQRGVRVLRVPFTTSRFADVAALARLFVEAVVEHRVVPDVTPLAALAERPVGADLDAAFVAAGLGVPTVPRYPRVVVLWDGSSPAQPVAVVVEGNEELWRSRPMPVEVTAPPDASDPTHAWWAARPQDWLRLEGSAAAPAAGEPPTTAVARTVRGPGDTRAVLLLAPGSRGTQLRLDLRHRVDALSGGADTVAPAVRVTLGRPPWEPLPDEED